MSQKTSRLTYQVNLPRSLIKNYHSPIFSTNNNIFWRILFFEADDCYYGFFLQPVASPDEIIWREHSTFNIFAKEIRDEYRTAKLLYNKSFVVYPGTHGYGCLNAIKKCLLRNGELIIGVIFDNIEYNESNISKTHCPEHIPEDLIDAWKDQLFNFPPADVEFDVQDEKFYVCSSILSKRSEYFRKMLSDHLSDSTFLVKNEPSMDNNSTCQIKHWIKISKYDPITISAMLEYLYTNKVKWTNKDNDSIAIKLFFLADQCLLLDLQERAKIRILNELTLNNEVVLNLMEKNLPSVKEILTEFFKVNKRFYIA